MGNQSSRRNFKLHPLVSWIQEWKIKRVAFTFINRRDWTGGYNYLLNLFRALAMLDHDRLCPVLFVGDDANPEDVAPFRALINLEIVQSPIFNQSLKAIRLLQAITTGTDSKVAGLFEKRGINVVFENATYYGWNFQFPTIAWLPDFQHRHLKHLFGARAYWKRDIGFRIQINTNRLIMLSSEDARSDCERFYPASRGRTAVVSFSVCIDELFSKSIDAAEIRQIYGLPTHFFYLPNQFWVHKNHLLVIEALKIIQDSGKKVFVAVSGNSHAPGCESFFADLNNLVRKFSLTDQFRFLGLIPRGHVIALMRECDALINPSLFEGWSTTVEEAKALGVPMILSSLNVHREQAGDNAVYFDPYDPRDLAGSLVNYRPLSQIQRQQAEALSLGNEGLRLRQFALCFGDAIDRAVGVI